MVVDPPRIGDARLARYERGRLVRCLVILPYQRQDLLFQLLRGPHANSSRYQEIVRSSPSSRLNKGDQFNMRRARSALKYCRRISWEA